MPSLKLQRPPKPTVQNPSTNSPLSSLVQHRNISDFSQGSDTFEQERHASRLSYAIKKQNLIFENFMKKYYIPKQQAEAEINHQDQLKRTSKSKFWYYSK